MTIPRRNPGPKKRRSAAVRTYPSKDRDELLGLVHSVVAEVMMKHLALFQKMFDRALSHGESFDRIVGEHGEKLQAHERKLAEHEDRIATLSGRMDGLREHLPELPTS